jgi:drug/metabolite transporter (DMT)-like permease
MLWFPLALGAALCWSTGAVLVKKGFASVSPLWNNIINNLLSLVVWIPAAVLLNRFRLPAPPWGIVAAILAAALLYQLFYYCLSHGQLSLTSTIIAGYPIFTILWSHLFLAERLTSWQYAGVSLVLAGGIAIALPRRREPSGYRSPSWMLWGLAGALCIGTGDFLSKVSVNRIGPYSNLVFLALASNLTSGLNYLLDPSNRRPPSFLSRSFLPTFLGIIMHLIGALFFLVAFGYGPASLVSTVSSIYPALLVVLAIRFLGENIDRKQGLGIGAIVAGLILIGLAGKFVDL